MHRIIAPAIAAALLLGGCTVLDASENEMPEVLRFAGVSIDATQETFEIYDTLLSELSDALGIPVEYYPTDSGPAVAEAMISGRVDIALMSVMGFLGASKTVSNIELVGVTKRLNASQPGYYSVAITKKGSGVSSLEDLRGEKVCFSAPASVTGDLLPTQALLELGIESRFDKVQDLESIMLGSSPLSFGGVRDGECIAGFGLDSSFEVYMPASGDIVPDEYDLFWRSDRVPGAPLVVNANLPGNLPQLVSETFINLLNKTSFVERGVCEDEASCEFLAQNMWGFVPASVSDYDFLLDACAETGYDICKD